MSLRNALLGLLAEHPMSGYDLTKTFDGSLGYVWSASHSQIYPELARLKEAGLIEQTEEGPRGRKAYSITEAGLAEVRRWLAESEPERGGRDEPFLRVFFLWLLEPEQALAYVRREGEVHRGLLAEYEEIADSWHPATPAERSFRICLEAGIRHERALLEWARWAESELAGSKRQRHQPRPA
jgi:PadR family transcriptional regulator AphA